MIHRGANRALDSAAVEAVIAAATPGDCWLTQSESALVFESMAQALWTDQVAAPFDPANCAAILAETDLLALTAGEAAELAASPAYGRGTVGNPRGCDEWRGGDVAGVARAR